jgi:hypothetical protein
MARPNLRREGAQTAASDWLRKLRGELLIADTVKSMKLPELITAHVETVTAHSLAPIDED